MESVFNASLEKHRFQVFSKGFTFEPRSLVKVDERFIQAMESEHAEKGLVVLRAGDDFKAKERQALLNYLPLLEKRIRNYQSRLDEDRKMGATVAEPEAMVEAKQWKAEIIKKLEVDAPVKEHKSFLDLPMSPEIEGMYATPKEEVVQKKKPGRPKSFNDVDIQNEVA